MLIPVEWLRDFVVVDETPEALAERLTTTGNEIEEIRASAAGPVFYLKLTPNRADMLSIRGAAREIAALYGAPITEVAMEAPASGPPEPEVRVEVDAPDLCARYVGRVVRGVRPAPSPEWLRKRLEAAGLRPINNVVDVTNYVMWEMGQPLHAFDLDLLRESRIVVRRARPGEEITLIDGTEARLGPENLVIADAERAVAVAGVMGGRETEVSESTRNILLESAFFDPLSVRRTSKRIQVSTAASYRFERGVDPNGARQAADRAAHLITQLAGGALSESVFDAYPREIGPREVRLRPERCRALLGVEVPDADAERFLTRLGLAVRRESPDCWVVTVPTWRTDLAIEEDLIEEVGRLYGYDRLPETLPGGASAPGARSELENLVRAVREQLLAQGLFEAVTNTLVSGALVATCRLELSPAWPGAPGAVPVRLRNPLSEETGTLRPSLLPGLLAATQHNLRRGTGDVFLFEAGYGNRRQGEGLPEHRLLVSGLLHGSRWSHVWNAEKGGADFYAARGTVEALARALGLERLVAERAEHPAFHPGRTAWLAASGERVGIVGELHPEVAAALDLPREIYVFELDGEALLRLGGRVRQYAPPSRYPRALRDLAVVVETGVASGAIERVLREVLGEWGREVRLFDVYAGRPLPEGRVSLAYALELGAEDRTLTDAEVDARLEAARTRLRAEFGAEFRG